MKIENIIRRILREEQEEEKLLKIPGLKFFNNDWNVLQKFLESQGNPRYSIGGNLDLFRRDDIESLGNLVKVEGDLNLNVSWGLRSLGNLEYVGGVLDLFNNKYLESLGDLKYVGGTLRADYGSNISSLDNLKYVGGNLKLSHCLRLRSLGNLEKVVGDLNIYNTPLAHHTEEQIRRMVEVGGYIFM
jgi:hypothetical protein